MSNNCLFPVKLLALLDTAKNSESWMKRQIVLEGMPADDGKTRIVLYTPEIHQAHPENKGCRYRLAFYPNTESPLAIIDITKTTALEVYDVEGKVLISSTSIQDLSIHQALAVQTEMMYTLLEMSGCSINSL